MVRGLTGGEICSGNSIMKALYAVSEGSLNPMCGKMPMVNVMEPSQILGYTEKCSGTSGTESGWTTYIASPIQENHHHHHSQQDGDDHSTYKQADIEMSNYGNEDSGSESDDSMASDASSGPNHHEFPCQWNQGSVGTVPLKRATTKYSSGEKLHKQAKQKDGARAWSKVEKQELVLEAKSAASHILGGAKIRKG